VPHVTVAVLRKSTQTRGRCHRDVRKEVEAPLDIKDVIHQISCFSKTIVTRFSSRPPAWLDPSTNSAF